MEETPKKYVQSLVAVCRDVRRVLKPSGTLWLNLGDSYNSNASNQQNGAVNSPRRALIFETQGRQNKITTESELKPKDLIGIPWMVAFALRADGWYLRADIIWHKPNPMPESVTDRPTKAHEYLFLLSKSATYYYDAAAIAELGSVEMREDQGLGLNEYQAAGVKVRIASGHMRLNVNGGVAPRGLGRNKRSVWTIPTQPYTGAHFATMPEALIEPCILAGCPSNGLVLDPFCGSGTVLAVAERHNRHSIGIDLRYHDLAQKRNIQRSLFMDVYAPVDDWIEL
jgi:DNA modification methylase